MILGFISLKTALIIIHLFGIALGAGGAFASDFMFIQSVKDRRITETEIGFLKLGSRMVWIGVGVLLVSGLALFSLDPSTYLASSKFLAKMSIVGIIIMNGIFFHLSHIPVLVECSEKEKMSDSPEFLAKRNFLLASGAISIVSWSSALILGALRGIPYSFGVIMGVYLLILIIAVSMTFLFKEHFLPSK
jgi:hypothetical protein